MCWGDSTASAINIIKTVTIAAFAVHTNQIIFESLQRVEIFRRKNVSKTIKPLKPFLSES